MSIISSYCAAELGESDLAGASQSAIAHHYDIGRDIYATFLDQNLICSAACWNVGGSLAQSLEEAQLNKLRYHLEAVGANEDTRLLDVGCGWGGLLRTAVDYNHVRQATGLTLSTDQFQFVKDLRLQRTEIHITSYERFEPAQNYDAIISVGAFEHFVRPRMSSNQRLGTYKNSFQQASNWLTRRGRLSLQIVY